MKQYCRYCANCHYGDFCYCDILKKLILESKAKAVNKCKYFKFNEIDVFDINKKYKPRTKKRDKRSVKQYELF